MKCAVCRDSHLYFLFHHHHGWNVSRCGHCGLVQVSPMPSYKEIAQLYHEDMDHFTPYLSQLAVHRAYFRDKVQQILRLIPKIQISNFKTNSDQKIQNSNRITNHDARITNYDVRVTLLDIGCALGVLLEEAEKAGIKAYGIDISADAVKFCKQKGLHVTQGTLDSPRRPLAEKTFDIITAFEIIEHERDALAMMKRIYTILNKGGIALLTTPNHASIWRTLMGKWWFGYQHPEHVFFFDPVSMKHLCERAGFRDIAIVRDTPRPFPLSFAFTRAGDYFPILRVFLKGIGRLLERTKLTNPINPWDDMLIILRK